MKTDDELLAEARALLAAEGPIRARPEFLQSGDIEVADQMVASLISRDVGWGGVVRTVTHLAAQMTAILCIGPDPAPPVAAAGRALAVTDLVLAAWEKHHARSAN